MLRCGKGSVAHTCTGASGAPITPSSSRKSDILAVPPAPLSLTATEGFRVSWPRTHWPRAEPRRLESPISSPSGSGPSMSGVSVSPIGLKLPDLAIDESELLEATFRRRSPDIGDLLRPGLFPRDLAGDRARTTERNPCPCFLSIFRALTTKSVICIWNVVCYV